MSLLEIFSLSLPLPEQMKVFQNSADEVFAQKMTENPFYERENLLENRLSALLKPVLGKFYVTYAP